jgi:hypothetical protein
MFDAALARCGVGNLRALDVSCFFALSEDAFTVVLRLHAGSLQELRVCHGWDGEGPHFRRLSPESVEALLRDEAPQLRSLEADVLCQGGLETALSMMRRTPPFAVLRLRGLRFHFFDEDEASLLQLAAEVSACATITDVLFEDAPLYMLAALTAVVDAALVRQLTALTLISCALCPASVPALVRLLAGGPLRTLIIWNQQQLLLDVPAATLLADSLRANTTLTQVSFNGCDLWHDMDAARTLLSALTGHASIQKLHMTGNEVPDGLRFTVGELFGSLLAADAAALQELHVSQRQPQAPSAPLQQGLGDGGMARLLVGLVRNTHLRRLEVSRNSITGEFAHEMLHPVTGAHPALRQLDAEEATFDASITYHF